MDVLPGVEEEQLTSRSYQLQLEEYASERNTIIHLPTGSGKTFIAISLIKRFQAAVKKPWGEGGQRTFFLVNTVPLVYQQKKVIERFYKGNKVNGYSSEDNVDYWNKDKWDHELSQYEVIIMTSQILKDMLEHFYIKIKDINLLIFDECHHAVSDHPMRVIMKHFEQCPVSQQPRVLGLTAPLLNANVKLTKVEESIKALEITFHATIATVNELGEVLEFSTNPTEEVLYYRSPVLSPSSTEAINVLIELQDIVLGTKLPVVTGDARLQLRSGQIDFSRDPRKITKQVNNMIMGMIDMINELGVYGGSMGILAYMIVLERLKRRATKEECLLYKFTITHILLARRILENIMSPDVGYKKIVKHSSQQMLQVFNILKEYNPDTMKTPGVTMQINHSRTELSGIIFVQKRVTAKVLYNILKEVKETNPKEFGFVKHDFILGGSNNPNMITREVLYKRKCSQRALIDFAHKELNLLISTSIIEEGVDIPQCMLVVRFDPPMEYRSYIQSKGRARSSDSAYVIMINNSNKESFINKYTSFQHTERYIQQILVGKSDVRDAPNEKELKELYTEDNIPPYVNPHTGGLLSSVSAISLLNRYCSLLPHDQFTTITPLWIKENVGLKKVVTILMPIYCPIKESIRGQPMPTLKEAKRSAALSTCIVLHQNNELDAETMLPRPYGKVDYESEDIMSCFPNWPTMEDESKDLPKAGTKKRVRKHKKVYPSHLNGPQNWTSGKRTFYLHVINLKIAFEQPTESRELALYKFLEQNEGFGLVTVNRLPQLCSFPMFLTIGEVTTTLDVNYGTLLLNLALFEVMKGFHLYIFDQILEIAKKFLLFDGGLNSLYVVPIKLVNDQYTISWDVMRNYKTISPIVRPPPDSRRQLRVTSEEYHNAVVSPWYRDTILPRRYIVSKVLEYMTPNSNFETDVFGSFADYYHDRYNLEIMGPKDQPLLEVRDISSRMNCLLPRAATLNTLTDKQTKLISAAQGDDKLKGFKEIFIPEFCVKYEFPGVLWYKSTMLPSIIHRVTMLLGAYELRYEIAKATNLGLAKLPIGAKWKPISLNVEVATKALLSQVEPRTELKPIDRINFPIDESAPRPANKITMKESMYQLKLKKLQREYPWSEENEPIDIDRCMNVVTLMDIECYDEFVSVMCTESTPETGLSAPQPPVTASNAALLPPKFKMGIDLLTTQPFGFGPELRDVLAALTTIGSNDTFNLERVETLGDSFLKFASTLYLFHKFPMMNEGQLTNIKSRLIGNRNLFYAGNRINLGGIMKVEQFSPRKDFVVPGFTVPDVVKDLMRNVRPTFLIGLELDREEALSGQVSARSLMMVRDRLRAFGTAEVESDTEIQPAMQCYVGAQAVSDKSVADCVEALIGTYLQSSGIIGATRVLEWLQIIPKEHKFETYLQRKVSTVLTDQRATVADIEYCLNARRKDVEEILGYKFKDPALLLEALSHSSYIRNRYTRSYERLEFLGDAILDFLITSCMFENHPHLKPGEMTDLRSALVNNVTFASFAVKLGLHKYICYQCNPVLDSAILAFVEHQETRDHRIAEEVIYLIDEEDCEIAEYVEVPKVLSDVFESLAGAIYLDSGGSLGSVWTVYSRIMQREIHAFAYSIPQQPVRMLYEMIHACPVVKEAVVVDTTVPRVMVPITINKNGKLCTVHGFGSNKFQAKRAAAKLALKILHS